MLPLRLPAYTYFAAGYERVRSTGRSIFPRLWQPAHCVQRKTPVLTLAQVGSLAVQSAHTTFSSRSSSDLQRTRSFGHPPSVRQQAHCK